LFISTTERSREAKIEERMQVSSPITQKIKRVKRKVNSWLFVKEDLKE